MKRHMKHSTAAKVMSVLMLLMLISVSFAQQNVSLLIQQTPLEGGRVNLQPGVHDFTTNSLVPLTATPKPGYQFVYWLGDVDDPTSSTTTVLTDTPKIIIAIFERSEFKFLATTFEAEPTSAPGGQLRSSARDYVRQGSGGGGGRRPGSFEFDFPDEEVIFPIPNPNNVETPLPVPGAPEIPEPATAVLLTAGGLLLRYRLNGKNRTKK